MYQESHLVKKNQLRIEQETCSCGSKGQENVDFKKVGKKRYSIVNQANKDVTKC